MPGRTGVDAMHRSEGSLSKTLDDATKGPAAKTQCSYDFTKNLSSNVISL